MIHIVSSTRYDSQIVSGQAVLLPYLPFTCNDAVNNSILLLSIDCLIHHCYTHSSLCNPDATEKNLNTPQQAIVIFPSMSTYFNRWN